MAHTAKRSFPEPVLVGQRTSVNPSGEPDPAGSTDCGEACLTAAIFAVRGVRLDPGCLRQALALPAGNGRTTAFQLALLWQAVGRKARVFGGTAGQADPTGLTLRLDGRYRLLLGTWLDAVDEHWVLAFHTEGGRARVMDPWAPEYRWVERADVVSRGAGVWVDLT